MVQVARGQGRDDETSATVEDVARDGSGDLFADPRTVQFALPLDRRVAAPPSRPDLPLGSGHVDDLHRDARFDPGSASVVIVGAA